MSHFNNYRSGKGLKMNLKLPPRWTNYTSIGKVVPGTKFLPFKTPLKEEICRRSLPKNEWFTPAMLLRKAPSIKLIIDLTQTDRFYAAEYFNSNGIRHHKIICPGGGKTLPSREIIQQFTRAIDEFLASEDGLNEDSLIGVHCTHGLNRTGYLICKYMVEHSGILAKDAIEAFEQARGHKIERKLYTNDIINQPLDTTYHTEPEISRPLYNNYSLQRNRYVPYADTRANTSNWRSRHYSQFYNQQDTGYNYTSSNYRNSRNSDRDNLSYNWRSRHKE